MSTCWVSTASFVCIVLCVAGYVPAALFTTTPSNTSVSVGDSVSFSCSSNDSLVIRWTFTSKQTLHPTVLYTGLTPNPNLIIFERYSVFVDNQTGLSELTIKRAVVEDEGIYVCTEMTPEAKSMQFQLMLFGNASNVFPMQESSMTKLRSDIFLIAQGCLGGAIVVVVIAGVCYKMKGYRCSRRMEPQHCPADEDTEAGDYTDESDTQPVKYAEICLSTSLTSVPVVGQQNQTPILYARLPPISNIAAL